MINNIINEHHLAKTIIPLIDLTSLNEHDHEDTILKLCHSAHTPFGSVAAVCVYPQYVKLVKQTLKDPKIKIAAVSNFPHGNLSIEQVIFEIQHAIHEGANEIDLVMPYQDYLDGKVTDTKVFVAACKELCKKSTILKVILETGALQNSEIIEHACHDMINAGADFLKTSTGKIAIGATLTAAKIMLTTIRESKKNIGFKASGGIRTPKQAQDYIKLAQSIMGNTWVTAEHFRLGASSLVQTLINGQSL